MPRLFYLPLVPTRGFVKPKGNNNKEKPVIKHHLAFLTSLCFKNRQHQNFRLKTIENHLFIL